MVSEPTIIRLDPNIGVSFLYHEMKTTFMRCSLLEFDLQRFISI